MGLLVYLIRNGTPSGRQVDSEHGDMMSEFDKSCVYQIQWDPGHYKRVS